MLLFITLLVAAADTAAPALAWVPSRMAELRVPGLAVGLVQNGRVAWTRQWGRPTILSGAPADSTTVWPVASVGKAVTAYAVLRLAQEGRLALDRPIVAQLPSVTFLARGEQSDRITPRHLLSHTSGLSNYLRDRDRELRFSPGDRFGYSGVGYMYLQHVIEQVTGTSFDSAMTELVFAPLGMESSWFGQPRGSHRTAQAHASITELLPPGGIMLGITAGAAWLLLTPVSALVRARWRFGRWHEVAAVVVATPVAWYLLARLSGGVMASFFTALAALAVLIPLLFAAGTVAVLGRARWPVRATAVLLILGTWGAVVYANRARTLPLPAWYDARGNAAASLRTTAGDLARFAAELASPRLLDSARTALLRSRAVPADSGTWWGLGVEVSGPEDAPRLRHQGSTPGAQSLVVAIPGAGSGVVVIANAGHAEMLVKAVAEELLGPILPQ